MLWVLRCFQYVTKWWRPPIAYVRVRRTKCKAAGTYSNSRDRDRGLVVFGHRRYIPIGRFLRIHNHTSLRRIFYQFSARHAIQTDHYDQCQRSDSSMYCFGILPTFSKPWEYWVSRVLSIRNSSGRYVALTLLNIPMTWGLIVCSYWVTDGVLCSVDCLKRIVWIIPYRYVLMMKASTEEYKIKSLHCIVFCRRILE